MVKIFKKGWVVLMSAMVLTGVFAPRAHAVDPPNWVAALYVDAQKSVGLRWMPAAGATGYKVLRSDTAGSGYQEIASTSQPQHFDNTVEPGSTYYYVLQAVAGAEASANSAEKKITIPGQKKKKVEPPRWTKIESRPSTEFGKTTYKVLLVWEKTQGAVAYNVFRSETPGSGYQLITSSPETQTMDLTVEGGKTYYYALTALDDSFMETPRSADKSIEVKKVKRAKKRKKRVKLTLTPRKAKQLWSIQKGAHSGKFDFWEPTDVAVDGDEGLVFAPSNNTFQVYVLDAKNGDIVSVFGERGPEPGQFLDPLGLDVNDDGLVFIIDKNKKAVCVFTYAGNFVREVKLPALKHDKVPFEPWFQDVAVDRENGDLYVVDTKNHIIWVVNEKGDFLRFIGEAGFDPGQLRGPIYMAFNQEGNLSVASIISSKAVTYTKEGKHVNSFGQKSPRTGAFVFMSGIGFDAEGNLLVVDKAGASIQGFLPNGQYRYHLTNMTGEKGVPIYMPKAIAVDTQNRLYIVEGLVDRVQGFQILGDPPPPQGEDPVAAAAAAALEEE